MKGSAAWDAIKNYGKEAKSVTGDFLSDMGSKAEGYVGKLTSDKAGEMYSSAAASRKNMDITASEYMKQKRTADKVSNSSIMAGGLANIGSQSGLVGAGIGAVTGLMSDDQSMLGGAMMGGLGGAALGAGSKALSSNKLAKSEMRAGVRGRRLRNIESNMPAKSTSENPATRLREDRSSGYVEASGKQRKEQRLLANETANIAKNSSPVNPYVTGGLAASGSLAYATLSSNRY